MSEKQTVSKFKDMVKNSLEVIKEFKEDEEITMSKTIVEIFTYVHAFKELTNLSESELENIQRQTPRQIPRHRTHLHSAVRAVRAR